MVSAPDSWHAISSKIMDLTRAEIYRNGNACYNKWNILVADYKKVKLHMEASGNNESYFNLGLEEKDF